MAKHCIVDFGEHEEAIRYIRHTVFTLEQGVDPAIDFDGQDNDAVQVLVYDNEMPVGTGRMLPDGHIGRIAVLAPSRGRGMGSRIIAALMDRAAGLQLNRVYLGAQVSAVPFYEKLGFVADGDNYMEANILHTPMVRDLRQDR